jgi:hypothetical protein
MNNGIIKRNNYSNNQSDRCPIYEKVTLSFPEASEYSGIGEARLRTLADNNPELVINIDSHRRLKRKKLEKWLESALNV